MCHARSFLLVLVSCFSYTSCDLNINLIRIINLPKYERDCLSTEKLKIYQSFLATNRPVSRNKKIQRSQSAKVTAPSKVIRINKSRPIDQTFSIEQDAANLHKVTDDKKLVLFMLDTGKQTIKFLDKLQNNYVNPYIKTKTPITNRKYVGIFKSFINKTMDAPIKIEIGKQRVILNTIVTSSGTLSRLLNYFAVKSHSDDALRQESNIDFNDKLAQDIDAEYNHACKTFGVCRSSRIFSDFVVDVLTSILRNDNTRVTQFTFTFIEYLKKLKVPKLMDPRTKVQLKICLAAWEMDQANVIRVKLSLIRNLLINRNNPFSVVLPIDRETQRIKTEAMLGLYDFFDEHLPPNDDNLKDWQMCLDDVAAWTSKKRTDIDVIIQNCMALLVKETSNWDDETNNLAKKKIKIYIKS